MKHTIHKAMAGLALSQQLADQFNAPVIQPEQAQPVTEQPTEAPQSPQEAPQQVQTQEPPQSVSVEPEVSKTQPSKESDQFVTMIEDIVQTDKLEEERRLKEIESQHETDLKTIKDRVLGLLKKRGKK